jgi:hypothetical protein
VCTCMRPMQVLTFGTMCPNGVKNSVFLHVAHARTRCFSCQKRRVLACATCKNTLFLTPFGHIVPNVPKVGAPACGACRRTPFSRQGAKSSAPACGAWRRTPFSAHGAKSWCACMWRMQAHPVFGAWCQKLVCLHVAHAGAYIFRHMVPKGSGLACATCEVRTLVMRLSLWVACTDSRIRHAAYLEKR